MRNRPGFSSIYDHDVKFQSISDVRRHQSSGKARSRHILRRNKPFVFNRDDRYRTNGPRKLEYYPRERTEEILGWRDIGAKKPCPRLVRSTKGKVHSSLPYMELQMEFISSFVQRIE